MKVDEYDNNLGMKRVESVSNKYYLMYLRKSSESEDKQVESINEQKAILAPLLKERNLTILEKGVFHENKSAKAPGRVEFNKMIQMIKTRKDIKGIICWKLNRLSRNPVDSGTLQWILQNGEINEIITPSKTYTEVDSDYVMSFEGAQANKFIRDLREDTLRGINHKLEKGIAPILAPVGYYNDTSKPQGQRDILPHKIYFPLMRKLFDLFLTGNYSVHGLLREAHKMGIRNNRNNSLISRTQMYRNLQNIFYTGRYLYMGVIRNGVHKRMITDEEYEAVQEILRDNGKPRPKTPLEFPLNGFIRCANCGMAITGERHIKHYKNGTSHEFRHYRCSKRSKTIKCNQKYVREKHLEDQVKSFLDRIEIDKDFASWASYWCNYLNKQQKDIKNAESASLQKAYNAAVVKLDNLLDMKLSPNNLLSEEDYLSKRNELVIERDTAKDNLDKLDKKTDEWDELTVRTFDFASRARERFEKGDLATKQLILRGIGSYLTLSDQKLDIYPRSPFIKIKDELERFVPGKLPVISDNIEAQSSQNLHWGG